MHKILILFFAIFLAQCGTQVPTERKVTKVENITGTPKKVFLEEKKTLSLLAPGAKVLSQK